MPAKKKRKTTTTRRRRVTRAPAPDLGNTFASVIGGGGGALLGGVLANKGWDPTMVALAMTVGGGVGAYAFDGNARIAANGLAAAGAGQLALSLLAKSVEPESDKDDKKSNSASKPTNAQNENRANASYLPPGAIESAFERARSRLAYEDEPERFIDIEEAA